MFQLRLVGDAPGPRGYSPPRSVGPGEDCFYYEPISSRVIVEDYGLRIAESEGNRLLRDKLSV